MTFTKRTLSITIKSVVLTGATIVVMLSVAIKLIMLSVILVPNVSAYSKVRFYNRSLLRRIKFVAIIAKELRQAQLLDLNVIVVARPRNFAVPLDKFDKIH